MIVATLRQGGRDGTLVLVNKARTHGVIAGPRMPTLQYLLDGWSDLSDEAQAISDRLNSDAPADAFAIDVAKLAAPLPRAYAFLDGSAYAHHMTVIRQVRGDSMPAGFFETPLLYQGCSDRIIGPAEPVRLREDVGYGVDIEAEVVVVTGDVPQGVPVQEAARYIRLVGLLNDVSLRNVIPTEIPRGFGFVQGKSASSMAPFLATPDELGALWDGKLLSGRYLCRIRDETIGELDPGQDATFNYADLIAHAARTRELTAGTILGAGAIANEDGRNGCGCIAELRAREHLKHGAPKTEYLRFGDRIYLEMLDRSGQTLFGAIDQRLEPWR